MQYEKHIEPCGRVMYTFIGVGSCTGKETPSGIEIDWFQVDPDKRDKGNATKMLELIKTMYGVIEPKAVLANARPFWKKMAARKLCTYFG